MESSLTAPDAATGQVLVQWQFPEYYRRERSLWWWAAAVLIWLGLALWAGLSQHSFLFILILLFTAIIFITMERRSPATVTCRLTTQGVEVDDHLYPFEDIENFYIVYQPPTVKSLYLVRSAWRPLVAIPLHNQNPQIVKEALAARLKEDLERQHEPLLDQVARVLGLH